MGNDGIGLAVERLAQSFLDARVAVSGPGGSVREGRRSLGPRAHIERNKQGKKYGSHCFLVIEVCGLAASVLERMFGGEGFGGETLLDATEGVAFVARAVGFFW